jgi:hypothetical protein
MDQLLFLGLGLLSVLLFDPTDGQGVVPIAKPGPVPPPTASLPVQGRPGGDLLATPIGRPGECTFSQDCRKFRSCANIAVGTVGSSLAAPGQRWILYPNSLWVFHIGSASFFTANTLWVKNFEESLRVWNYFVCVFLLRMCPFKNIFTCMLYEAKIK